MATPKGLKGKVERHGQYKTPRRIYDIEPKPSKKEPQEIAEAALKKAAGSFKINPDLSQLKLDKVKENILGRQVLSQQYHEGTPISGAWVGVDIDQEGRLFNIQSDLIPEPVIETTRKAEAKLSAKTGGPQLSADEAKQRALEVAAPPANAPAEVLLCELVYYPHNGVPTLAWKLYLLLRFEDAANALITADKNRNQGKNEEAIRDIFVRRGIMPNAERGNKRAGVPFEEISGRVRRRANGDRRGE